MSSINLNLTMPFLDLLQSCEGFRSLHRTKEGWFCRFVGNGTMKETKTYKNPVKAIKEMKEHD